MKFCREHRGWWPCEGFGYSQQTFGKRRSAYVSPKTKSKSIIKLGEEYHIVSDSRLRQSVQHNSDWGKTYIQRAMQAAPDDRRVISLFDTVGENEHLKYLKHLTAEQLLEENGEYKWQKIRQANEYLDATVLMLLAARLKGMAAADLPEKSQETKPRAVNRIRDIKYEGVKRIRTRYGG